MIRAALRLFVASVAFVASGRGFGDAWLRLGGVCLPAPERNAAITPVLRVALPDTGWSGFFEPLTTWDEYAALARLELFGYPHQLANVGEAGLSGGVEENGEVVARGGHRLVDQLGERQPGASRSEPVQGRGEAVSRGTRLL